MLNNACTTCHARKVRCSGTLPCSNCIERGTASTCVRVIRKKRSKRKSNQEREEEGEEEEEEEGEDEEEEEREESKTLNEWDAPATATPSRSDAGSNKRKRIRAPNKDVYRQETPIEQALISVARETLGLQSTSLDLVRSSYHWRASASAHACVHIPRVLDVISRIFSGTDMDPRDSMDLDLDEVALAMITVALGMQFLPRWETFLTTGLRNRITSLDRGMSIPKRANLLAEYAKKWIEHQMIHSGSSSLAQIQTINLLLLFDAETTTETAKEQLFDHAVRTALRLGIHRISSVEQGNTVQEMSVRCWWFLVCRSWLGSVSHSAYTIHPAHFTSRLPQVLEDISTYSITSQRGIEQVQETYLPVRYSLVIIKLAELVRRIVDIRLEGRLSHLDYCEFVMQQFDKFCHQLPKRFSLDTTMIPTTEDEAISSADGRDQRKTTVERWFLHQQIFHAFLELYTFQPQMPIPETYIFFSLHILDTQESARNICSVTDTFRSKIGNTVKACSLLVMDMLQKSNRGVLTSTARSITLGKVKASIRHSQELKESEDADFALLVQMMNLEEEKWLQQQQQKINMAAAVNTDYSGTPSSTSNPQTVNTSFLLDENDFPSYSQLLSTAASSTVETQTTNDDKEWEDLAPTESSISPLFLSNDVENSWKSLYELLAGV